LLDLDVDDIERAVTFYTQGVGLSLGRRFDSEFVELVGGGIPLYLLAKAAGSAPFTGSARGREYTRHWTPLHVDFVVADLEAAIARAEAEGARRESAVMEHTYGRLVYCSDPFGHGFCLLEFRGRGYAELLTSGAGGATQ
jgi:lactoylglutathione lyase